jgi:Zn-dependent alcohol dehydrogenase
MGHWISLVSFDIFQVLLLLSFSSAEYKTRDSIPKMITDYINKNINDPLITPKLPFEKINEALELFKYETGEYFCVCDVCVQCVFVKYHAYDILTRIHT